MRQRERGASERCRRPPGFPAAPSCQARSQTLLGLAGFRAAGGGRAVPGREGTELSQGAGAWRGSAGSACPRRGRGALAALGTRCQAPGAAGRAHGRCGASACPPPPPALPPCLARGAAPGAAADPLPGRFAPSAPRPAPLPLSRRSRRSSCRSLPSLRSLPAAPSCRSSLSSPARGRSLRCSPRAPRTRPSRSRCRAHQARPQKRRCHKQVTPRSEGVFASVSTFAHTACFRSC